MMPSSVCHSVSSPASPAQWESLSVLSLPSLASHCGLAVLGPAPYFSEPHAMGAPLVCPGGHRTKNLPSTDFKG